MSKARGLADLGNVYNDGALSNRNLIINPTMAVAQRPDRAAVGYTTPFYAGPDRWQVARSGTGLTGFSRQANTGFGGTYAAQATFTAAATESWNVQQRIESANIAHLAGQDVTLSFYVSGASTAGSSTMFAALNYANSVDNFSADTEIANFSVAYSGTITKFTFTFTLPASAVNGVSVVLRGVKTDATGDFTLTFGGVQLEAGDTATPLEHRSYGQELALCHRYYRDLCTGAANVSLANAAYYNQTSCYGIITLPVTMRATPTLATSSPAHFKVYSNNASNAPSSLSLTGSSDSQSLEIFMLTTPRTAGDAAFFRTDSASASLQLDAEL